MAQTNQPTSKPNPLYTVERQAPPPYYPSAGQPNVNHTNHPQIPLRQGWSHFPPPPPPYQMEDLAGPRNFPPNVVTVITSPTPTRVVLVGNGCPNCRIGMLVDSYNCFALFMAIFFFPLGILCCLAMREKQCTNCGASF